MNNDNLHITNKKLSCEEWDEIESKISFQHKEFIIAMGLIATNLLKNDGIIKNEKIKSNNFKMNHLFSIYYKLFIEKFSKYIPNDFRFEETIKVEKEKKNTSSKKGAGGKNKIEQIRNKTFLKRIDDDLKLLSRTTSDELVLSNFNIYESSIFNYILWFFKIIKKKDTNQKLIFDALLSISRISDYFKENYDDIDEDLYVLCNIIIEYGSKLISIFDMQIKYPELITQSTFDTFTHAKSIKLYKCQEQVLMNIYNSLKNDSPLFMNYQTPPGAGKTSLVISISKIAEHYEKQVVYICYNDIVRNEVSKMAFHSGATFAIISECKIRPHNSCWTKKRKKEMRLGDHEDYEMRLNYELNRIQKECDKQPTILVCDLLSSYYLCKVSNFADKYIAYVDEPTAGSEYKDNILCQKYVEIILNCPKRCICLSATMPKIEETPLIYKHFQERFETNSESILCISSSIIPINCMILNNKGELVAPHNIANSLSELQEVIEFMEEKPFLLKFYTSHSLYNIYNVFKQNNIKIEEEELKIKDVNHQMIRLSCLKLLKMLLSLKDESLLISLNHSKTKISKEGFNMSSCCSDTSHEHLGQTLIICKNDECHDLVTRHIPKLLEDNKSPKLGKQIIQYEKEILDYTKKCNDIEKNMNAEDKTYELSELITPLFKWDSSMTINSKEHIYKFSNLNEEEIKSFVKFFKLSPIQNGLSFDVLKELPTLYDQSLLMGVGVIDPSSDLLNSNGNIYPKEILKLASTQVLSYISSNSSISYGTNLPIQKVIIENTGQSQNTLHQQLGRVGRVGKSLSGCAVFKDDLLLQKAFTKNMNNIEAENINLICSSILNV